MIVRSILRRPRVTLALTLLFVVTGVLCMWNLPVETFPSITPPAFRIKAKTSELDSQDADYYVAQPLSKVISDIPDVLYYSTVCVGGEDSWCDVVFRTGVDDERAMWRLREAVRSAEGRLPENVVKKGIDVTRNGDNEVLTCAIRSKTDGCIPLELLNDIKSRILVQDGVEGVEIHCPGLKKLRIVFDSVKLANLDLSVSEATKALLSHCSRDSRFDALCGTSLRIEGFEMSIADMENMVLREDSATGGRIMLKNVACVIREIDGVYGTRLDGSAVNVIKVKRKFLANAAETAEAAKRVIERYARGTEGVECVYIVDATSEVKSFLGKVAMLPILALALVAAVLFLFWRSVREVLVPVAVIGASLVGSFVFQSLLGFTFNALTIFGFLLVIGSLVDDALVVIEMARADRAARKLSPRDAMATAVRRSFNILAVSTVISALCYLPLVFIKGIASQMYLQFAFTSFMALALSAVFAVTLTPVLFTLLLRGAPAKSVGRGGVLSWCAKKWRSLWHISTVFWTVRPYLAVVVLVAATGGFFVFRRVLPKTLFRENVDGKVLVEVVDADSSTASEINSARGEIIDKLAKLQGVKHVFSVFGQGVLSGGGNKVSKYTVITDCQLMPEALDDLTEKIKNVLSGYKGVRVAILAPTPVKGVGRFSGLEFHLCVTDRNSPELLMHMRKFLDKVSRIDGVSDVETSKSITGSRVKLSVDAAKAEALGVSPEDVERALQGRFESEVLKGIKLKDGDFDIELTEFPELGAGVDEMSRMQVQVSGGRFVNLSSIGAVSEEAIPQCIERFRGKLTLGCVAKLKSGGSPEKIVQEISEIELPDGISLEWSGVAVQEIVNRGGTRIMIILSLIFAYLLFVAWYESWILPIPCIGTAFIAVFGSLAGLYITGEPLDVYAQVALVAVVGIALKGSSIIVDSIRGEYEKGHSLRASALMGAARVFRPVQMTIWTSLFGVMPFLITFGYAMPAQRVLGAVMVSGVLTVLFCGFSLTPALYIVVEKFNGFVSKNPMRLRRRRFWESATKDVK